MQFVGKKALVFGGTKGIGFATCIGLAEQGAKVIAISRNAPTGALPSGITFESCDVLDREALSALFKAQAPFDMLVSTATGGARALGPFLQMDMDGFQGSFAKLWGCKSIQINLTQLVL